MHTSRTRLVGPAVALASLLVAAGCTSDADWDRPSAGAPVVETQLESIVDAAVADEDVPGVVAAVRFADGTEWVHAAGVADPGTSAPLEDDLIWPLRSITKSFAVTVLMELADEGVLSLDDTVSQYVDGLPNGDEITLEQLALMTSGLPDYTTDAFLDVFIEDPDRVFTDDELLAFSDGEPAQFPPDSDHVYTNTNTNTLLLGKIIGQVSGMPVGEVIEERLLAPLGLDDTSYLPALDAVEGRVPTGHQPDEDGVSAAPLTFGVFGAAGAMSSTVQDLLSWGPVLGGGTTLSSESQATRMDTAAPLSAGPEYDRYGLGIGELEGWWGHTGEGLGYTSLVMHDPVSGTTLVVFANVSNLDEHPPTAIFREMAAVLSTS